MTTPKLELPPQQWVGLAPTPDGRLISLASEESIEARERILLARIAELESDAERLDYIERTFAGCTTQDRYLPIRMIWGKGCNGRTLREACDKYMARDAARGAK